MSKIAITDIIIERNKRQRTELQDLEGLTESIKRNGVIQPVVLDDENKLIAGERRTTAAKAAGLTEIPFVRLSKLSTIERERIELEENIKRSPLSWKDECAAVTKYYELRRKENPEITQQEVADELAMGRTTLTDRLLVQAELEKGNELVVKASGFSVAKGLSHRAADRRDAAMMESIADSFRPAADVVIPTDETPKQTVADDVPLINADFTEWAATYTGPRFNFLHLDLPYGINADKHNQGAAKYFGGYADSPDVYWTLIAALGENMERLVADSAHMMFWFSMDYYAQTKEALETMGWKVNPFPLIWFKSDNTGILPDPTRGPRRVYETAFFCSIGDRKIIQPVANTFGAAVTKDSGHMSEKSYPMLLHFMRMTVDETTIMLDPTCGSGNSVRAAKNSGAKSVLGIERDPEFYNNSVEYWKRATANDQISFEL